MLFFSFIHPFNPDLNLNICARHKTRFYAWKFHEHLKKKTAAFCLQVNACDTNYAWMLTWGPRDGTKYSRDNRRPSANTASTLPLHEFMNINDFYSEIYSERIRKKSGIIVMHGVDATFRLTNHGAWSCFGLDVYPEDSFSLVHLLLVISTQYVAVRRYATKQCNTIQCTPTALNAILDWFVTEVVVILNNFNLKFHFKSFKFPNEVFLFYLNIFYSKETSAWCSPSGQHS